MACNSLDRHQHAIAYESFEKLLSARDEKEFVPKRRTRVETPSQTLSGPVRLCPTQLDIVWSDQTLSGWGPQANSRKMNCLRLKPNFTDMI
jgi:hypothetical protein